MSTSTVQDTAPYEEEAAVAMRSYLQRTEVRLSTMHRIAGAFLSGAGLLLILPLLLKDNIASLVVVLSIASLETFVLWAVPFAIALFIPVFSLYLLFRDLCLFYFTANIPSVLDKTAEEPFHPRFSLTAIPFSDVTFPQIKKKLRELQFQTKLRFFLLPYAHGAKEWLAKVSQTGEGKKVQLPDSEWLPIDRNNDRDALRMAFGIAGAYDRNLIEECAKSELSLIRHNLHLRRLVMRYMKALLILVWTAVVAIVIDAVQKSWRAPDASTAQLHQLAVISVGNLVWAGFTPIIVRAPVKWIYGEYDLNIADKTRDQQIVRFEQWVIGASVLAYLLALASLYRTPESLLPWGTYMTFALLGLLVPAGFFVKSLRSR